MVTGIRFVVSALVVALLAASAVARAAEPARITIDKQVPALRDGSRMSLADVESAILEACARHKLRATVVSPGVISARQSNRRKSFEVTIPYSESGFSVRYQHAGKLEIDQAVQGPEAGYDQHVALLIEHIESDLARTHMRLQSYLKPLKREPRIRPRTAA